MTRPAPTRRSRLWLIDGNTGATLASLAREIEAGRLDTIDHILAIWALRRLAKGCGAEGEIHRLQVLLDPHGTVPDEPAIPALRCWIAELGRAGPRGTFGRLAASVGLHQNEISKLRAGSSLTPAKVELLSAALIAAGTVKAGGAR